MSIDNSTFHTISNSKGIFELWIPDSVTKVWVKINNELYYFDVDGTTVSQLHKYEVPVDNPTIPAPAPMPNPAPAPVPVPMSIPAPEPDSEEDSSLGFVVDGVVTEDAPMTLTNWVTITGVITADTGYQLADEIGYEKDQWTQSLTLSSGVVYEEYIFYRKNSQSGDIKRIVMQNVIVDSSSPVIIYKCSVKGIKLNKAKKNVYKIATKKTVTFTINGKFGLSGKKKIQYQVVAYGKKYNKNKNWITLKSNKVKLSKKFKGVVYFKLTNKAGVSSIYKTYVFAIKK